jgi:hypothetical protein
MRPAPFCNLIRDGMPTVVASVGHSHHQLAAEQAAGNGGLYIRYTGFFDFRAAAG